MVNDDQIRKSMCLKSPNEIKQDPRGSMCVIHLMCITRVIYTICMRPAAKIIILKRAV